MKSPAILGLAWVASVVLAYFVGANVDGKTDAGRSERTRRSVGTAATPAARTNADRPETDESTGATTRETTAARDAPAEPEDDEPYTLEGVTTIEELSRRLMKFAAKKLAAGPEGHKELFRELDRIMQDKELRKLARDERDLVPLLGPWLRFLMAREQQVVGLTETLYKTAAEEPEWFEGLDDDSFEVFTEGVAMILPSFAGEEQMKRFRGYAQKIIAHDAATLPRALKSNVRRIQRGLEWWTPALTPEQTLTALADPAVPLATKLGVLRRVDPGGLKGVDLSGILADAIRSGNAAVFGVLDRVQLNAGDVVVLDSAMLDAAAAGRIDNWYRIRTYLRATNRSSWVDARPFVESGLSRGEKATDRFAMSLSWLTELPPKEYVQGVLQTYRLSENTVRTLRKRFGIE